MDGLRQSVVENIGPQEEIDEPRAGDLRPLKFSEAQTTDDDLRDTAWILPKDAGRFFFLLLLLSS